MESRAARVARGGSAAALATLVAAVAHMAGGGEAPTAFGIFASFVLSAAACTLLAGRTLSLARQATSVGLSQALFHGLFSTIGSPTAIGHVHTTVLPDAAAHPGHSEMFLAHLAAGLVTLVALRHGERAFWAVIELARLIVARLLVLLATVEFAGTPPGGALSRTEPIAEPALLGAMRYRGPPAGWPR